MPLPNQHTSSATELQLQPVLDARWALKPRHVAATVVFALFFVYLSYQPIGFTELWGHVIYGNAILIDGQLPTQDPILPLAEGMPVLESSWLSDLILASVNQRFGGEGLSALFALVTLATYIIFARAVFLRTSRLSATFAALAIALVFNWFWLPFIRPEVFGTLCLAVLIWLLETTEAPAPQQLGGWPAIERGRPRGAAWLWLGLPVLFVAWANLDASFVWGLVILGCRVVAQAIEAARYSHSLKGAFLSRDTQRGLLQLELAAAATLCTPYGIDLWLQLGFFAHTENLSEIAQWQPLNVISLLGVAFFACWALSIVLFRTSRARLRLDETLALGALTVATLVHVRASAWLGFVMAITVATLLADVFSRLQRQSNEESTQGSLNELTLAPVPKINWRYSLVALLVVWLAFVFSPTGNYFMGGKARTDEKLYGELAPLKLATYLEEHPTIGQVFNPHYWGDWLQMRNPYDNQLFATNHVQVLPDRVWRDYLIISEARSGWERTLDRYRVNTLIVDKHAQPAMVAALRSSKGWKLRYEDPTAMVLTRRDFVPPALQPAQVSAK